MIESEGFIKSKYNQLIATTTTTTTKCIWEKTNLQVLPLAHQGHEVLLVQEILEDLSFQYLLFVPFHQMDPLNERKKVNSIPRNQKNMLKLKNIKNENLSKCIEITIHFHNDLQLINIWMIMFNLTLTSYLYQSYIYSYVLSMCWFQSQGNDS